MSTQPRLPNELIELSLSFLTPGAKSSVRALLRCQAVSKGVASIAASPKLWQPHTEQWNTRSISNDDDTDSLEPTTASRTVAQTAEEDGGQRYYRYRAMRDLEAIKLLHELCASTNNHIQYITKLAALGQDVLDVLSEFHEGPIEGKHALSMRYWSVIASGVILRAEAVRIWCNIRDGKKMKDGILFGLAAFSAYHGLPPNHAQKFVELASKQLIVQSRTYQDPGPAAILTWKMMAALGMTPTREKPEPLILLHQIVAQSLQSPTEAPEVPLPDPNSLNPYGSVAVIALFCAFIERISAQCNVKATPIVFHGMVPIVAVCEVEQEEDDWLYLVKGPVHGFVKREGLVEALKSGPSPALTNQVIDEMCSPASDLVMMREALFETEAVLAQVDVDELRLEQTYSFFHACAIFLDGSAVELESSLRMVLLLAMKNFPYDIGILESVFVPLGSPTLQEVGGELLEAFRQQDSRVPTAVPRTLDDETATLNIGHYAYLLGQDTPVVVVGWGFLEVQVHAEGGKLRYDVLSISGDIVSVDVDSISTAKVSKEDRAVMAMVPAIGRFFHQVVRGKLLPTKKMAIRFPDYEEEKE